MDHNFEASLLFTLKQEGDFSDDPHDPGGPTYKGITLQEFRDYFGVPNATADDLKRITPTQLSNIYRLRYWFAVDADALLPDGVDCSVFDMGVNAGPLLSIELMQTCLGVTADGIIGIHTIKALSAMEPAILIRRLYTQQNIYYRRLSNFKYFGKGWLNRSAARLNASLALLAVAPWPQGKAVSPTGNQ